MYKLSVIITAYQAEKTIAKAIKSVLSTSEKDAIEIIVVDDCSSDGTLDIVKKFQEDNDNIKLFSMPSNTGSPSEPRNFGVRQACGEYVTFLDDDDEIILANLMNMVEEASTKGADFAKGYLLCIENGKEYVTNRLPEEFVTSDRENLVKNMITMQSTTQDFLVKRELLLENDLKYRGDMKIGEDTIFILSMLQKAKNPVYIDKYFLKYNKTPVDITNLSSTQKCGDREMNNQIVAWEEAEKITNEMNLSYYKLRLPASFRNLLVTIVRYSDGISSDTYNKLYEFAVKTKKYISGSMNLGKRYQELYEAILSGNYASYCDASKRRLLIAGYDLKFIQPVIPYLESSYNIKVDEWTGHNSHNEKQSREMAAWADIIWCEWLLGNAVFYSKIKSKHQRLVIRAHRFEITREFGNEIDYNNVDAVFMVGYYYYEKFMEKFSIPRHKARLLSNYCEDSIYDVDKTSDYKYHIGLVGVLPSRKGFLKGLQLLRMLVEKDSKFKLYVMGKGPQEVSWISNNPSEAEYYKKCEEYIKEHNLSENVVYGGFVERNKLYNELGFVLSLSDDEIPESFHLAPAEGACAGSVGLLLSWPGVEYIYPSRYIYNGIDEMAEKIKSLAENEQLFDDEVNVLREYMIENYSMDRFLTTLNKYLNQVRIKG